MKVGDVVKTKVPGFGTGPTPKSGIIVEVCIFGPNSSEVGVVEVMHDSGKVLEWYPWQLEIVHGSR